MCGINGFNFVNEELVKSMNSALHHRGPDDFGEFIDKNISLGHKRLAIIDLSKEGHQPMTYIHKNKKFVIVFNGEIYNYLEIKEELKNEGYTFKSNSDTEVILASYIEWGQDCVNHFNGMWAFCIYDISKKTLFLSRDRIGKKPLYYHFKKGRFVFSSELKGILCYKKDNEINPRSVDFYFSLGFIPSPMTIYKEINKLEPGHNLFFNLSSKKLKKWRYYHFPVYSPLNDKKALIDEGMRILEDATRIRMISDVPLGAFLSGGLDSSIVVKTMTQFTKKENLNTFSIGFEGKFDETPYIQSLKKYFKINHSHRFFRERDFIKDVSNIFYYYDEPFSDPSMFPTFFLSRFSRKDITVATSGDGGDEVFGGYPRYITAAKISLLKKIPAKIRGLLLKMLPEGIIKQGIFASLLPYDEIYSSSREDIYKPDNVKKFLKDKMRLCLRLSRNDLVESFILMDRYFLTLPDNYLTKVDRASMAHALEVRSPFLDYRFFEYASKIPSKWKASITKTKILMREMIKGDLPNAIVHRKKKGFTPPIQDWILKEEYEQKLKDILDHLQKMNIISLPWRNFYENRVFKRRDIISKNYRIRLFLFYEWAIFWNIVQTNLNDKKVDG